MSDIEILQPPDRGPKRGPKAWIALSALAALLVGIALARWNRSARGDREERLPYVVLPSGDPAAHAAPATPAGGLPRHLTPPPSVAVPDRLPAGQEPAQRPEQLPFKDFLARLKAAAEQPQAGESAAEFSKEFNKQPGLKNIFDGFKKRAEAGEPVKAGEFLAAVRAKPEFRQLAARFASQPATTAVYRDPVLRNLVLEKLAAPEGSGAGEARRSSRGSSAGAESPAGRPGPARRVTARSNGGAQARARIAQAQSGGFGAMEPGGVGAAGLGVAARPAADSGEGVPAGGKQSSPSSASGTPGSEAHATAPLAALNAVGPDQSAIAFYLSLFGRTDPGLRRDLEGACDAAIARNEGCEIITLCWAVGMSRCRKACAAAGEACKINFPADPPPQTASSSAVDGPATSSGGTPADPGSTNVNVNVNVNVVATAAPLPGRTPPVPETPPAPHATSYADGLVYDSRTQVMTYGGTGPETPGYHTGYVSVGDTQVGTYFTDKTTGLGTVQDAAGKIIYIYDGQGNVSTCPCP